MNDVWYEITEDPVTLPPLGVPVFVTGGSLSWQRILVRDQVYDEKSSPAWAWCECDGLPYWDEVKKQWAVWDTVWDSDHNPSHWHAFPDQPEVQNG